MIKRHLFWLLMICPLAGYGQFGVNVKYLFGQSETLETVNLSQDGLHASLEYSFRLKQKRLEFHPGLGYRFTFNTNSYDGYFNAIDLDMNTAVYPFDFAGDCDCPTWSKDGTLLKKGLFLEVSPGVSYQTIHRYNAPDGFLQDPVTDQQVIWKLGGALGLDIGITEQFTLTPMFSYTILSSSEWDGLNRDGAIGTLDDFNYLGAGMRFTYKPDPKRRRRF
jgi:hypothetical protein